MGLNFKLDVGSLTVSSAGRAHKRYMAKLVDAKTSLRERFVALKDSVKAAVSAPAFATAVA